MFVGVALSLERETAVRSVGSSSHINACSSKNQSFNIKPWIFHFARYLALCLGLVTTNFISDMIGQIFLGIPSCKKWLSSDGLRPFIAVLPHQRLGYDCKINHLCCYPSPSKTFDIGSIQDLIWPCHYIHTPWWHQSFTTAQTFM